MTPALQQAIDEYVRACGGDPATDIYGAAEKRRARLAIERAMQAEMRRGPRLDVVEPSRTLARRSGGAS